MFSEKEKLLYDIYQDFIDQMLGRIEPDTLNEIVYKDIMGFGTTIDEKVFGVEALLKTLEIQKRQSEGLDFNWKINPLSRYVSPNGALAAFADDLLLNFELNGERVEMHLRTSVILEYRDDKWLVVHWHGSKPEEVQSEVDTFGIESWKQKVETLEKLVAERTKDLVKKNRELEVETSLERVRARTMAMQHSDELAEASLLLDQEVRGLGIGTRGCAFNIYGENESTEWFSSEMGTMPTYKTPHEKLFLKYIEEGQKGNQIYIQEYEGAACPEHYEYLCTLPVMGEALKQMIAAGGSFPSRQIDHVSYFKYGYLLFITLEPAPLAHKIFIRFAQVFEQTYTRFLDLQKAEAQAREAQIEAALERVRSRSMAMHRTAEIQEVIHTVHVELIKLNISIVGGSFIVINKDVNNELYAWASGGTADTATKILIPDFGMPFCTNLITGIKKGSGFFTEEFSRQEKITYFTELFKHEPWSKLPAKDKKAVLASEGAYTRSVCVSKHSGIFIVNQNGRKFTEEENDILKRFSKVFEQTYTRFLDLQKAEAQAREAEIELALERVRARTMAMQHSDELLDAATLLFQQIELLGAPSWNCSFNIWDEDKKHATAWNGTKEGFGRPFKSNSSENVFLDFFKGGQKGEKLLIKEIGGTALENHYKYMSTVPGVSETLAELKAAGVELPTFQIFYIAYFTQGYLMFITYEPVPEFQEIFKRFAKVFEQTYTRFLDLQKAEAQALRAEQDVLEIKEARQKAEEALSILQATQSQLIQSEKMASLGELTAGIAHEIQNPLNFVNNFSEVSKELLDEMKAELNKGNNDDAKEIADNVIQNLEKITNHGKRADAIVKGMLQHSRSSSGKKEPTDINALCDEFLRLSYYGLRAKDKSFNATMKTDFDATIGSIDIVPQDIGRVILNLLTNAFYAANEKKQLNIPNYDPTVTISTKKRGNKVEIIVGDNGSGIPQKILDKIFQPFFTTKPTGQGTGLGLSMSHDIIVKGHGGELKVETSGGVGTTFTIII